jgi:hypothetical protein
MAVGVYMEGRMNLNRIRESVQRANIIHTKPNYLSHYLRRHLTLCKQINYTCGYKKDSHDNRTRQQNRYNNTLFILLSRST